jgi:hypothetical protein
MDWLQNYRDPPAGHVYTRISAVLMMLKATVVGVAASSSGKGAIY